MRIEEHFAFYHAKKLKGNGVATEEWHPVPLRGGVPLPPAPITCHLGTGTILCSQRSGGMLSPIQRIDSCSPI